MHHLTSESLLRRHAERLQLLGPSEQKLAQLQAWRATPKGQRADSEQHMRILQMLGMALHPDYPLLTRVCAAGAVAMLCCSHNAAVS